MTLLCVCTIVYVFCNGSPCHHLLLTKHRPALLSALHPLVSHKPSCQLSVISPIQHKHPYPVWIRTLCQRLIASPCSKRVFLVRKCVCYGQFSSEQLMSPKRSVVDDSGTPSQPSQASPDERPSSCKNHLKPPPLIQSSLPNLTVPMKPLEILAGEATRTIHADGGEEESATVTEHEDRHQDVASRRGAVSCRRRAWSRQDIGHLMRCSTSATSTSLLEHSALRTVASRKIVQQTLEHFQTTVADRKLSILDNTETDTDLTMYSNTQDMFWVQHHRGNTLMAALTSPMLETRRWQATKISLMSAGWKLLTPRSHTKSFFPQTCGYQSQQNWAWRADGA